MRGIRSTSLYVAFGGILRRPTRATLTVLCIAAAFSLFGVLKGVEDTFDSTVDDLQRTASVLQVASRVSRTDPLPVSHLTQLDGVPGVAAVVQSAPLLGFYQDPKNWVGGFAIDVDREFAVYRDFRVEPEGLQKMRETRTGAIVGRRLAQKYGWKVGDRVPLKSQIWERGDGSYDWAFDVVGLYEGPDARSSSAFLIRYDYFDEERSVGKGTVGSFSVRVTDAREARAVGGRIDALFANSAYETLTQSGREQQFNRFRQLGDVKLMVSLILAATLILVLFVTANTIRQSTQERLWEFAVLQALGYDSLHVALLVVFEALCLVALGAVIGIAVASLLIGVVPEQFGTFSVQSITVLKAALVTAIIVLLSALLPAWRAKTLPLATVLRRS